MTASVLMTFCYFWLGLALVVHVLMFFFVAPFGRHTSTSWGPSINNRVAWAVMELPSLVIMSCFLVFGSLVSRSSVALLFLLWMIHYAHRSLVYPLRIRPTPKRMPILVMLLGVMFNVVNASINGYYLAELAPPADYSGAWLASPWSWLGLAFFVGGFVINIISDSILINLRRPGETNYRIPHGFLFRYVASPNLFGEILEWGGFALLSRNVPALCFFAWTCANLIPRAKNHRDWYVKNFPDFPKERKIVIPFLL